MRLLLVLALLSASAARAVEKHAMAVYHFNLQYVAGGLKGWPSGESTDPAMQWDEAQTEDAIVREGFEPLLDVYVRHPTWGADFELQAYMIDVLRSRHPAVLAKLKTLADRGQISVDSFHWSDQLWLAYPRRDSEKSFELVERSFAAAALPLGRAVWTQEGQWAPGFARFMKEHALEVAVLPRNLFKHYAPGVEAKPIYKLGDRLCVVTNGAADDKVQTAWTFVDDGELAVTGDANPYLGSEAFRKKDKEIEKLEANLTSMETDGWAITTVAKFAKRAVELGVVPAELPTVLDGTWQPGNTGNLRLWMGGAGLLETIDAEDDNGVLSRNARVGQIVRTAEAIAPTLKDEGLALKGGRTIDATLDEAWRELLLAEVSDATGWNPFITERRYSETHAAAAERLANEILAHVEVADRLEPVTAEPTLEDATALVPITFEAATDRHATAKWQRRSGTDVYEVELAFGATTRDEAVAAAFARTHDRVVTTLALEDDTVVDHSLADLGPDTVSLGLPTGLVGLADDLFLIERTGSVHVAALIPKAEKVVRFLDETAPAEAFSWKFVVVKGTKEAALAEAHRLNVKPTHTLGAPGCGCAGEGVTALALAALVPLLRRRRRA